MKLTNVLAACACALAVAAGVTPAQGLGVDHPALVSANPADNTPHISDGTVYAIAKVGNVVYVGGTFTTVVNAGKSAKLPRSFLLAYDATTGAVLPFAPTVDGAVETIAPAPDGTSIIIGGRFKTVNGVAQRSLAMIAADGSRVASFAGRTNGYVLKALVRGSRLVVAGRFSSADGTARSNLAVLNASNGALDTSFDVPVTQGRTKSDGTVLQPSVLEMDADASGSRLVVIGNFRTVGGLARQQIAMIDLAGNKVAPWFTNRYPNGTRGTTGGYPCYDVFDTPMRDVEFAQDGSYFVVVTTGGAGDYNRTSLCDTATRWETNATVGTTGAVETWRNCTGGDTLYSVSITKAAVYVGGHQRWLDNCGSRDAAGVGSFAASGIGAIDPVTGRAIRSWNPGRDRGVGAEELVATSTGLHIGSDTASLGGEHHARVGYFPLG
jgi:hypothetical protein